MTILAVAMEFNIVTTSTAETIELGRKFGQQLKGGEIICLIGTLGSGKTHLIKGIADGAGADKSETNVNSPTFVLVNEYQGRFDIYHIDAYRFESIEEFEQIGFDDFCYRNSVVLIEWADKIMPALNQQDCIVIKLEHKGQNERSFHFKNISSDITL